jgi:hypothetical protein
MDKKRESIIRKVKGLMSMSEYAATENERIAANRLIDSLCSKYCINQDDIILETKEVLRYFKYGTVVEKLLIVQVIMRNTSKDIAFYRSGKRKAIGAYLTEAKYISCEREVSVFKKKLNDEIVTLFHAFVQKNNILPPDGGQSKREEMSKEEIEQMLKVMRMMDSVDKTNVLTEVGFKKEHV